MAKNNQGIWMYALEQGDIGDEPITLLCTYDEHKALAVVDDEDSEFFAPYRDLGVGADHVIRDELVLTAGGKRYRKLKLSIDFFIENGLQLPPPIPKLPQHMASYWAPYFNQSDFIACVRACPKTSAMAAAVRCVQVVRVREQLDADGPLDALVALVLDTRGDAGLIDALDAAIPDQPEARPEQGEPVELDSRVRWRMRLLYALLSGIQDGQLAELVQAA